MTSNSTLGPLPVGETVWPGYAVAPLLLWPGWMLVAAFLLFALVRDALSRRKKGSNVVSA
jgi:hypothetical protein